MTCNQCNYEFRYPCGCNWKVSCRCEVGRNRRGEIDWVEVAGVCGLIFLSYLALPLAICACIPIGSVILLWILLLEERCFRGMKDEVILLLIIPITLIGFNVGLILNVILAPIGIAFGPSVLLATQLYEECRQRRRARINRANAIKETILR